MHSRFSRVRSSQDLCARAFVHSLEGTLLVDDDADLSFTVYG